MSKELIERLRSIHSGPKDTAHEAADRIEELEREASERNEDHLELVEENHALQADNTRLRDELNTVYKLYPDLVALMSPSALAATPEQSLARIRNQVREECAKLCKDIGRSAHGDGRDDSEAFDCADAILATKEPIDPLQLLHID